MADRDRDRYNNENTSLDLDYTFEDLDTSWLNEFEQIDKEYSTYYTEDLLFVKVNYIYINKNQEITNIYEDKYLFKTPNILIKEDLIGLIKRNTIINQTKYSLLSILKYNINIEPNNLKTFFRSKNKNIGNAYLQSVKHINDVAFDKTISMFHDLNNVMIIFIEKEPANSTSSTLNATKRVYIHQMKHHGFNYKKTRRNLFKDNL